MSEFKGTLGPWIRVDTEDYAEIHPVSSILKTPVALVAEPANADLVSAAPDLLELLIEADKRVIWEFHIDEEFQGRVESAISKALGEK